MVHRSTHAAQAAYNQAKTAYDSLGEEAYADYAAAQSELTIAQNTYKQVERSTAAEVQAAQDVIDTQTVSTTQNETTKQLADLYRKVEKTTVVAEQDGISCRMRQKWCIVQHKKPSLLLL